MNKKVIRLTESDLHKIVKESVNRILDEGIFDMFKKHKETIAEPNDKKNEEGKKHIYSVQELQSLYDNQTNLTPFQQKVLNAAMWVRARNANYHGYTKEWSNVMAKDGDIFYWEKGQLRKVGT